MKKLLALSALAVFFTSACATAPVENIQNQQISVVASFYPLAHFASQVGQNYIKVTNLTPGGAEPHDFEPSPSDIQALLSAKLILLNGGGLEPWAQNIIPEARQKGIQVIEMTNSFELVKSKEDQSSQNSEKYENEFDPHIWLDPLIASQEIDLIQNALSNIDPTHAPNYIENAAKYQLELDKLDQNFSETLKNCALHEAIVSHNAFAYLGKRYNITFHPLSGLSPQSEPSAQYLAELANLARSKNIQHIYFETLVSPKLAQTLANEIGAQTLVLNPLEGLTKNDTEQGKTYISIMQENLENLKIGLKCN